MGVSEAHPPQRSEAPIISPLGRLMARGVGVGDLLCNGFAILSARKKILRDGYVTKKGYKTQNVMVKLGYFLQKKRSP